MERSPAGRFFPDGSRKTLGIMQPGEFEFKIGDQEIMEILSGDLEVLLEGEKDGSGSKGERSLPSPPKPHLS